MVETDAGTKLMVRYVDLSRESDNADGILNIVFISVVGYLI